MQVTVDGEEIVFPAFTRSRDRFHGQASGGQGSVEKTEPESSGFRMGSDGCSGPTSQAGARKKRRLKRSENRNAPETGREKKKVEPQSEQGWQSVSKRIRKIRSVGR